MRNLLRLRQLLLALFCLTLLNTRAPALVTCDSSSSSVSLTRFLPACLPAASRFRALSLRHACGETSEPRMRFAASSWLSASRFGNPRASARGAQKTAALVHVQTMRASAYERARRAQHSNREQRDGELAWWSGAGGCDAAVIHAVMARCVAAACCCPCHCPILAIPGAAAAAAAAVPTAS